MYQKRFGYQFWEAVIVKPVITSSYSDDKDQITARFEDNLTGISER